MKSLSPLPLVSLVLLLVGCGGEDVSRYRLQGSVTFNGQPVPAGTIRFEPDAAAGNVGASGSAVIVDGKYDTQDKGIIGGPHIAYIDGAEKGGPNDEPGKTLFNNYSEKVDFPKESGTKDFTVDPSKVPPPQQALPEDPNT